MYPMATLHPRRAAVLAFIRDRVVGHGQPPTLAEIAAACGLATRAAARKHVLALTEAGLIEVTAGQARGIRPAGLPARAALLQVPVLGRVAAGAPIGADAGLSDTLTLDPRLFSTAPDYLLRVQGDSMIEDGIFDGDYIFVKKQLQASRGEIVVAMIGDEATVKRYYPEGDTIRFQPANAAMQPIIVRKKDFRSVNLIGIVVGVYRKMT